MGLGQLRNGILGIILHLDVLTSSLAGLAALNVQRDGLLDGKLDSTLGDEAKIGTGEAVGVLRNELNINVWGDRGLAKLGLENACSRGKIGQRNVDEGIETSRTAQSVVELLRSVGGTNNEDILLRGHTVHLSQKLVDDTVRCATSIAL
ncbi:hypothetical protein HBI56_086270 [Parastagonospora nodorum]|nr:hypothetical protein HBH50_182260 [Parastagonospora nodorum]KAH4087462.1 hypothetical protein HBH48_132570 [Parastagonospora nodorum]KAH4222138.1 hypothetical protein HBI06_143780 [Parastagonospora nodorum]KAH4266314.1 hypothetical protein HBI03_073710 [Parastagonospora nodorum]KAH4275394.1 hypothetical protein HBI04_120900 [Parastagonospora nodorum]